MDHVSVFGFDVTVQRLTEAIEGAGLIIFARIDHAAAAKAAGMSMPPTIVILYGHPKVGTPVMLAVPRAALDLPLRVLIRKDASLGTVVSYSPIVALLEDIGVPLGMAERMARAQSLLFKAIEP
jgi:uncharacterized protein (DUF302 family)